MFASVALSVTGLQWAFGRVFAGLEAARANVLLEVGLKVGESVLCAE